MTNLTKFLHKQVSGIPRYFLRSKLKQKLKDQGVKDKELLDALTDHILNRSDEQFCWDDGADTTKNLSIVFTKEEQDELVEACERFLKEDLPEVLKKSVQDSAKSFARELEKRWPEQKIEERNDARYFRDRIDLRWSKGLDPLRILLTSSREVGQDFADRLARSKAKRGIAKREALMILHTRACQTSLEILILLENGLADGAYARWRTLYEISVVALVIDRFGDEIAERYLAHDVVSMRESAINELRHQGRDYDPDKLQGDMKELEEEFQELVAEFGKSFAGQYGWAAHNLGKKAPRFSDLERAVDWDTLPPDYKWSSFKIHAGIAGGIRGLGSMGGETFIHAGASNAGIDVPAINTAFSLLHVTSLVFGKRDELENSIQMQALVLLRDKVVKECSKAAKKLQKDEMEIRTGMLE